jgi:hypothetical protein
MLNKGGMIRSLSCIASITLWQTGWAKYCHIRIRETEKVAEMG